MSDITDEIRDTINLLESIINADESFIPPRIVPQGLGQAPKVVREPSTDDGEARSRLANARSKKYSSADEYAAANTSNWPIYNTDPPATKNRIHIEYNTRRNEWLKWKADGLL